MSETMVARSDNIAMEPGFQERVDRHFQSNADFWEELYDREDLTGTIYQWRRAAVLRMVDRLQLPQGTNVLEVGCGAGLTTTALAQRGFLVEAIDTVQVMVERTRQNTKKAGVEERVTVRVGDAHWMSYESGSFDLVVAVGIIPWLHSVSIALSEIARVLKPHGLILVSADNRVRLSHILDPRMNPWLTPVRQALKKVLQKTGLYQKVQHGQLAHLHSPDEFDRLLGSAGFTKLLGMTLGFGPFTLFGKTVLRDSVGRRLHEKLQTLADGQVVPFRSTGAHYLVLGTKLNIGL